MEQQNNRMNEVEQTLLYPTDVLQYLASKVDDKDIEMLRKIYMFRDDPLGYHVSKESEYRTKRNAYVQSIDKLEAQGFIRKGHIGTFRPIFTTIRGEQLLKYAIDNPK